MKLIYAFDALCGWCWGFSPVIKKLQEEFKQQYDFEVVSGGLILGERVAEAREIGNYVLKAIPQVEATTGITFGKEYKQLMHSGTEKLDSMPPAKFLALVKQISPSQQLQAAQAVQEVHFSRGKNLNLWPTYEEISDKLFPSHTPTLQAAYFSPEATALAKQDFIKAYQLGIQGYPAVLLNSNKNFYTLSRGYTSYQNLKSQLAKIEEDTKTG